MALSAQERELEAVLRRAWDAAEQAFFAEFSEPSEPEEDPLMAPDEGVK